MMVCEASIRSDMAKRIMHSILPDAGNVNDPAWAARISSTKGVMDYNSLAAAAEGKADIIKYGTLACVEELRHFTKRNYNGGGDQYFVALDAANAGKFEEAIDICVTAFGDYEGWGAAYGGKAWEKIAKTIKNLIVLEKQLKELDTKKSDEKFEWKGKSDPYAVDAKIDTLNDIVIQLNVFDGLAHNTGSIMPKVIGEEGKDFDKRNKTEYNIFGETPPGAYDYTKEKEIVLRMMDAKELQDSAHVYKEIEDTLKGSGDINRWKDWTGKITSKPSYNLDPQAHTMNLIKVKIHKVIKDKVNELRALNAKLAAIEFSGKQALENINLRDEAATLILTITTLVRDCNSIFSEYAYSDQQEINDYFKRIYYNLRSDFEQLDTIKSDFIYGDQTNLDELHKNLLEFYELTEKLIGVYEEY